MDFRANFGAGCHSGAADLAELEGKGAATLLWGNGTRDAARALAPGAAKKALWFTESVPTRALKPDRSQLFVPPARKIGDSQRGS